MKKLTSILLAILMLCVMLCVPAFAVPPHPGPMEETEISAEELNDIGYFCSFSKSGETVVPTLCVTTVYGHLSINKDATIKVTDSFSCAGSIKLYGTLDLSECKNISDIEKITIEDGGTLIKPPVAVSSGQTITAPGTYIMHVSQNDFSLFSFIPPESDFYTFKSLGAQCDPFIGIFLDGERIAGDFDSGENYNFCLAVELEADKTYTLQLWGRNGDEDITVEISRGRHDGGPASFREETQPGEYPVTAGYIDPATILFIPSKTGGYTFTSSSANFSPRAQLYDPDGNMLADCSIFYTGEFCFYAELTEGKTYLLDVTSGSRGYHNFNVVIEEGRHDGGPASFGEETQPGRYTVTAGYDPAVILFTPQESGIYIFSSDAGNFDVAAGGCIPCAWLYDGEILIGYSSEEEGNDFHFSVELEAGKPYRLECGSGMYDYRSYDVIIEKEISSQGSILSQGNITIVVGIAGVALGLVGGFLLGRKKKPAASSNEE